MLRAIFYLECDYCRDSFSSIQLRTEINGLDWCHVEAGLEESAFEDGWCHCLNEDTGKYLLMCLDCEETLTLEAAQLVGTIEF
jgi:hypothetical protein